MKSLLESKSVGIKVWLESKSKWKSAGIKVWICGIKVAGIKVLEPKSAGIKVCWNQSLNQSLLESKSLESKSAGIKVC
jgi:hypothetical protein